MSVRDSENPLQQYTYKFLVLTAQVNTMSLQWMQQSASEVLATSSPRIQYLSLLHHFKSFRLHILAGTHMET
jgi:hypothetical protein